MIGLGKPRVTAPGLAHVEFKTVTEDVDVIIPFGIALEEAVETPSSLFSVPSLQVLLFLRDLLLLFHFLLLRVMIDKTKNGFWSFLLFGDINWSTMLAEGFSIFDTFLNLVTFLNFRETSFAFFRFQIELLFCRWILNNNLPAVLNFRRLLHDMRIVLLLLLNMYQIARS